MINATVEAVASDFDHPIHLRLDNLRLTNGGHSS